ncbi:MAG: NAD(P)-binding protein [Chitinivibrionales bacterium]|nr:NAD(P)-binding protein [Chitinivibrionales bacterium]
MVIKKLYDTIIIGAGAAGMAAACEISDAGFSVAVLDRENHPGGILMQCIHNGFGLHHFNEELTGPEYAELFIGRLKTFPVDIYLETTAVDISAKPDAKTVTAYSAGHGVLLLQTRSIVLAMGCRERNRGNIGIPGTRAAGIFTAGLAQRLLNIEGCIPGKRVVIVGSGDIGLIMARRMTWVGANVLGVVEILPYPSGLTRNIVQCLQDFDIPLYLSHGVTNINGKDRVDSVEISPLINGAPDSSQAFTIPCDTVLLSVGLIPENELSQKAEVVLNPDTGGPIVDQGYQTNVEGVFACGNALHVHDLVDYVTEESERCGKSVAGYLKKGAVKQQAKTVPVAVGANLKYVIPNQCESGRETRFYMRSMIVKDKAELIIRQKDSIVHKQSLRYVRPAEMISLSLKKDTMKKISPYASVEFSLR